MDCNNVKNLAVIELLHKSLSLAKQELYGTKSPYCWDEAMVKYSFIKAYEAQDTESATKKCICFFLNDNTNQGLVGQYLPSITNVYIPINEQSYRGTVATEAQMIAIAAQPKVEGWWWSVIGNFTYNGDTYLAGDEIFWNSLGFHQFGASSISSLVAVDINTGALQANVAKSITHNLGKASYQLEVKDNTNNVFVNMLMPDPGNPTNRILIEVGDDIPDGLIVSIIGY